MRFLLLLALTIPAFTQVNEAVNLRGHMDLSDFSLNPGAGSDIWGFTDPNGREYAIMTANNGTMVIDITDPSNMVEVGAVPGNNSSWRDAKTYIYDNTPGSFSAYAFVTTEASQGLQIIDLSDVPNSISLASTYNGFSSAHNIFISPVATEPYAYILGSNLANGGIVVLDIADPLNPVQVGAWSNFYTHDFYMSSTWADPAFNGRDIGVAFCGSNNLSLIDFTDKTNPVLIQDYEYPTLAYCHAGWVTEDGRHLYINDEFDEGQLGQNTTVYVIDLIDMTAPALVHTWIGPTAATDHNSFVKDNYLHMSNYRRGYTILDISNPILPEEVGFYDTYPANNNSPTSGAWGAYPWYDSGVVAVSDISTGLYILEPEIGPSFTLTPAKTKLSICDAGNQVTDLSSSANAMFTGTITLSTENVPAGLSVVFSVNPLTPGSPATMTISPSGMAVGSYSFTLRASGTGAQDRTSTVDIEVINSVDAAPSLSAPENGDACAGRSDIALIWTTAGGDRQYQVQVATDAAFTNMVVDTTISSVNYTIEGPLADSVLHHWRVRTINNCGTSPFSAIRTFTSSAKTVLLVNDNSGTPNVLSQYTGLLDTAEIDFDVYNTLSGDGPTASQMAGYQWIVWFSGPASNGAGPSDQDELELAIYLDGGGKLFLAAQDYYYTQSMLTPFMSNFLGIASVVDDAGNYTSVNGAGALTSVGHLGLNPYIGSDYSDIVNPGPAATSVLVGNNSNSAAVKTNNTFFAGFVYASAIQNTPTGTNILISLLRDDYDIVECSADPNLCQLYDVDNDGFDISDYQIRCALWGGGETLFTLSDLTGCLTP